MKEKGHWLYRHRDKLKSAIRIIFGIVWLIDGLLKFTPGTAAAFPQLIQNAGNGQPGWLIPWFDFWSSVVGPDPFFWATLVGVGEILIGIGLIVGGIRKITYTVGMVLSLFIWAVPEGFGGPYGPGSTDIGTGIIYSLVFVCLMVINAGYGPSKYSIDAWIEKRVKWWSRLAEFR
ncbi:MAG: DoxX family membrane protein [Candidatus Micrarchaeales archaeon]|nr:DoxX family membrane protein [Candidatus Micrarchaeales archaeon]